jgi:Mn-dependent DtxR family transcriptional regulator
MLEKFLKIVSKGGSNSLQEIAEKLGISKELLLKMIEDLERGGYLKLLEGKCSTECKKCPFANSCVINSYNKIWVLTEKGFKFVEKS